MGNVEKAVFLLSNTDTPMEGFKEVIDAFECTGSITVAHRLRNIYESLECNITMAKETLKEKS